jgi:CRP-like cAMP-binding protein
MNFESKSRELPDWSKKQFRNAVGSMINLDDFEYQSFISNLNYRIYSRKSIIHEVGTIPNEIYFILNGILRVKLIDKKGEEHTVHFSSENQFIADYSAYLQFLPAQYSLESISDLDVIVLPRAAIDWGYSNLAEGQKLGRLIAEFYFIYQDNRINNLYNRTPSERYQAIKNVFPDIHNRVPQHMIASYLGITPVHLSRLKKTFI